MRPSAVNRLNVSQRLSMSSIARATSACRDILARAARIQVSRSATSGATCFCRMAKRCSAGRPLMLRSASKMASIRRTASAASGARATWARSNSLRRPWTIRTQSTDGVSGSGFCLPLLRCPRGGPDCLQRAENSADALVWAVPSGGPARWLLVAAPRWLRLGRSAPLPCAPATVPTGSIKPTAAFSPPIHPASSRPTPDTLLAAPASDRVHDVRR